MSPRAADPAVRRALIERAARLLVERRPVTLRQLAADVGVSTMAVYTHFGGMEQLLRAVRLEAFEGLGDDFAAARTTKDPVADLLALGWSYCRNALSNPDLYRVMFLEPVDEPDTDAFGAGVFLHVVSAVERCFEANRFTDGTPMGVAVQMWGLTHGFVTLTLRGVLTVDDMIEQLSAAILAMLIGYGDARPAASRSVERIRRKMQRERPVARPIAPEKPTLASSVESRRRASRTKSSA